LNFRADLNALRAIAVLAVVIFHFNLNVFPGGFAGVDVFFVISGFLMTGIIFKGLGDNSFSLFGFYIARINRILPALIFLCLTLIVFGCIFLKPFDLLTLAKHIAASISFVSNIIFSQEAGYFDGASQEKYLLHTWSLSVEWQFYILYPLLLLALKKYLSIDKLKLFVVAATILCFLVGTFLSINKPVYAYFLLPARAWEMLIGGLVYLYPVSLSLNKKNFLLCVGLIGIFLSFAFITNEQMWPGYLALLPVISTGFIIAANVQNNIIMNNTIFQMIGKWSYSIYLWHWPIVTLGYIYTVKDWVFVGLPLSIFMGWLGYKYIESYKFRKICKLKEFYLIKPLTIAVLIFVISTFIYKTNGLIFKYPDELQRSYLLAVQASNDWDYPQPNLKLFNKNIRWRFQG